MAQEFCLWQETYRSQAKEFEDSESRCQVEESILWGDGPETLEIRERMEAFMSAGGESVCTILYY